MKDSIKIKYNLIVGVSGQIVALLLGILVPRLVLTNYGSEINGLLSSITNIYSYIAIVEAGVAAASCQALYKAISNKQINEINSILSATNKYYHKSGLVYLGFIFLFSIIYPFFIKSDISYDVVVWVILFNGLGNVINYFFHGKYLILLKADGKNYIRTGLEIFTNTFKQVAKIILISMGFNVVMVQFAAMLTNFAQMLYINYYIKKKYSWINLDVAPNNAAISQTKNVLVHEINYLITSNVDTVILTVFGNLKMVSVYSVYHLLVSMINRVLRIIKDSFEFKIAHFFHTDSKKFDMFFNGFESCYIIFAFILFTVSNIFFIPFLSIYTSGVTDTNYLIKYLPHFFIIVNLLGVGRYPSEAMIHIAGHFKQTQKSAVLESIINVVISIILVNFLGIFGVLIGTIISSLYRTNYLILYVNKNIIKRSSMVSYKNWILNFLTYILIMTISSFIKIFTDSYFKIFLYLIPYTIIVSIVYIIVNSIFNREFFVFLKGFAVKMFKNRHSYEVMK